MKKLLVLAAVLAAPLRARAGGSGEIPYPYQRQCAPSIVDIKYNTFIIKNGDVTHPLGTNANGDYKVAACSGDVAWVDSNNLLHKNDGLLSVSGQSVRRYEINDFDGSVVWFSGSGDMTTIYKDAERLGDRANGYKIAVYTGDVIWQNDMNQLFRNRRMISSAVVSYQVAPQGRVTWVGVGGVLGDDDHAAGD